MLISSLYRSKVSTLQGIKIGAKRNEVTNVRSRMKRDLRCEAAMPFQSGLFMYTVGLTKLSPSPASHPSMSSVCYREV